MRSLFLLEHAIFHKSALYLIIRIHSKFLLFYFLFRAAAYMRHSWRIINFPTSIWNAFNFSKWLFSAMYAVLCSSFPLIWIEIENVRSTRIGIVLTPSTMGIADSLFHHFFSVVYFQDYVRNSQINNFPFPILL